jgi:cytochrome b
MSAQSVPSPAAAQSLPMAQRARVPVFDGFVRLAHLLFIAGVVAAWFTRHARGAWHEWIGYTVMAALALRLLWGFIGPGSARFSHFVRGPRRTLRYAVAVWRGEAPRHLGHNPLGAWMILALLSTLTVIVVTGWMFTTDRWFGYAWVIRSHELATWTLFALVPLHVLGVLHASYTHRENLVASMLHGRKAAGEGDDVGV